jgi:small-conductance mechanosensitive channel
MTARRILLLSCVCMICMSAIAAAPPAATPSPSPSVSATPAATESLPTTVAGSLSEISAQRAAAERTKIYRTGRDYSVWLDQVAKDSGSEFLQQRVFDRVTWMRLIASVGAFALLSILAGALVWVVGRHTGEIESSHYQSALLLTVSAIRKPVALFLWVCGGAFALMPIATGIIALSTRIFLVDVLITVHYAGRVIAVLWLVFRAIRAVEKRMRQWAERTGSLIGKVIIPIFGQTLRLAVPLLIVILLLPLLRLPENWAWVTKKGFGILLIAGFSYLIIRGINAVQAALFSQHRIESAESLRARKIYTQVSVIRKIIVTAVVIIATGSILMLFDPVRQFGTSILASAGIAGIVIGFAAQRTLGNVLAGIQIALTQPILIDDIVVVEGDYGQIEEITLTYVTVRTWDLRRLVLPITYFVEKPFQNWSRVSTALLGTVMLYLDYQVPMGVLRKELKRLAESNPKWDGKVCGLQVTDTKQNTIEVRALVSSNNPAKAFDLRCEVREGLIDFLCRNYPESLPRIRHTEMEEPAKTERRRGKEEMAAASPTGKEHERGDKSPGVQPGASRTGDSDGQGKSE